MLSIIQKWTNYQFEVKKNEKKNQNCLKFKIGRLYE